MSRTRRSDNSGKAVTTLLRVGPAASAHRAGESVVRMRSVRVRAAMKAVPRGIPSTTTLEEAEEQMDAAGVNWLPVLDHGRLVGLITRLDIRQALAGNR